MKVRYLALPLLAATAACASISTVTANVATADPLLSATGQSLTKTAANPTPKPELERIVPVADHHQHLWSPLQVAAPPLLPEVKVPSAIATLLQKRASLWNNPDAMKDLYTENAMALAIRRPQWVIGDDRTAWSIGWIAGPLYKAYGLMPVRYRAGGSTASISGYYVYGEQPDAEPVGFFHIDAQRVRDGTWRIASEVPSFSMPRDGEPLLADELIANLDQAGIRKAVVLSQAYSFDGLLPAPGDEYTNVRWENDWTAQQVMRFPDRLVAFCSFNPLRDHALAELERCAKNPAFKGIKLHLGTSPVDLDKPRDVTRTRRVFEAANRLGLPLQVHLAASPEWGRRQAETFLNEIASAAPDVQIVVAHLWGGAGYSDPALSVFADAVASGHPTARNLYFDVAQAAEVIRKPETLQKVAGHMRRIGLERFYYGSDGARGSGLPPKQSWEKFRKDVPLTPDEFAIIAANVAPWVR